MLESIKEIEKIASSLNIKSSLEYEPSQDLHGVISKKAFELWERDGRREGWDIYYWKKAEESIKFWELK